MSDWDYCPLDLFSQDTARMQTALRGLSDSWLATDGEGNNFRLFQDGNRVVSGTARKVPDFLKDLKQALGDIFGASRILPELRELQRGLFGDQDIESIFKELSNKFLRQVDGLSTDEAADKLRGMKEVEAYFEGPSVEEMRALSTGKMLPTTIPVRYQYPELRQRIIAFALSATFKDCSITIRLPVGGSEKYKVKLIDLDLKPVKKFWYWWQLDRDILRASDGIDIRRCDSSGGAISV